MNRALWLVGGLVVVAIAASVGVYAFGRSTATTTTTTTSTSTTSTTTTSTTTATTAACEGGEFTGTVGSSQGAAGTVFVTVTLTSDSASPCTVDAWPNVEAVSGGTVLATSVVQSSTEFGGEPGVPTAPSMFTVAGDGTMQFALAFSDVPSGSQQSCPSATALEVSVGSEPGTAAVTVSGTDTIAPCGQPATMWVSPLYT